MPKTVSLNLLSASAAVLLIVCSAGAQPRSSTSPAP